MTIDLNPLDHNLECRYCDEHAGHDAECPWVLSLLDEIQRLRADERMLTTMLASIVIAIDGAPPEWERPVTPEENVERVKAYLRRTVRLDKRS